MDKEERRKYNNAVGSTTAAIGMIIILATIILSSL